MKWDANQAKLSADVSAVVVVAPLNVPKLKSMLSKKIYDVPKRPIKNPSRHTKLVLAQPTSYRMCILT